MIVTASNTELTLILSPAETCLLNAVLVEVLEAGSLGMNDAIAVTKLRNELMDGFTENGWFHQAMDGPTPEQHNPRKEDG